MWMEMDLIRRYSGQEILLLAMHASFSTIRPIKAHVIGTTQERVRL